MPPRSSNMKHWHIELWGKPCINERTKRPYLYEFKKDATRNARALREIGGYKRGEVKLAECTLSRCQ